MDKYIDVDGLKTHYRVYGNGPALILMHGWGCQLDTVESIAKAAADSHTVYNVDLPGHGQTPEPPEIWDVYRYEKFLEDFMAALSLKAAPSLAGHSFGGRLAIIYASKNPVDKLILIDAAGVKPKRSLKYYFKVYSYKSVRNISRILLGKTTSERIAEKMRRRSGSADYRAASPVMRAVMSKVVNQDLCHLMPNIKCPTLLIWGENDTATPVSDAKRMEKLIPDAGLVVLKNADHYSFLRDPHTFAAVLKSFLNS